MAKKEALLNIHAGLYYPNIIEEYSLPSHINTLIGKDKYRWFKKVVYITNHSNIEKVILIKENLR